MKESEHIEAKAKRSDHRAVGAGVDSQAHRARRPYSRPSLTVYGDIYSLAEASSTTGAKGDGGSHPVNKTL